jgi:hypothetical protein
MPRHESAVAMGSFWMSRAPRTARHQNAPATLRMSSRPGAALPADLRCVVGAPSAARHSISRRDATDGGASRRSDSERGILATKEHWLGLDLLKRDCGLSGGGWRMSNPLKGHRSAYVMALHVLAYDLTRVINIMGTNARSRVSRPNPRPQRPEPELVRVNL